MTETANPGTTTGPSNAVTTRTSPATSFSKHPAPSRRRGASRKRIHRFGGCEREHASVTITAAAVLTVIAVLTMFVVKLGAAASDRAKAQGAADAAALAGAADGRSSAETLAQRNGAELTSYAEEGDDVIVTVEVNGAQASARARHSAVVGRFEDLTDTSAPGESTTTTTVTGETFVNGVLILRPPTSVAR